MIARTGPLVKVWQVETRRDIKGGKRTIRCAQKKVNRVA